MLTVVHLRRFSSPNEGHWSKRSKQRFRKLGTRTRWRENRIGVVSREIEDAGVF